MDIMKLEKKFKVRIKHYSEKYYIVQYCFYYFIPFWWLSIDHWFDAGYIGDLECYSDKLFKLEKAEEFAELLTPESLKLWDEKQKNKMKQFYIQKEEYRLKNIPYSTKIIK